MMAWLPDELAAGDLELRRWRVDQVDDLLSAIAVSMDELGAWMAWAQALPSATELRAVLHGGEADFDVNREWNYAIFESGSGALVGSTGLNRDRDPTRPEIGYWIRSDRADRGYATRAARAVRDAAFTYLTDVDDVVIRMDLANAPSAAVAAKAGFQRVGEEDRPIVARSHTGRGLLWIDTRARWSTSTN